MTIRRVVSADVAVCLGRDCRKTWRAPLGFRLESWRCPEHAEKAMGMKFRGIEVKA